MTTRKQYIGTPFLVHFLSTLGALPSRARPYKLLTAQYVYVLPAEKMEVNSSLVFRQLLVQEGWLRTYALTMSGKIVIPRFPIAMTYGEAAAEPELPPTTTLSSWGSRELHTMPTASAPPMKKIPKRT